MKNIENYNLISQAIRKDVQIEDSGCRAIGPFEVHNPMDLLTVHEKIGKMSNLGLSHHASASSSQTRSDQLTIFPLVVIALIRGR
jgi:hypothetical protein